VGHAAVTLYIRERAEQKRDDVEIGRRAREKTRRDAPFE